MLALSTGLVFVIQALALLALKVISIPVHCLGLCLHHPILHLIRVPSLIYLFHLLSLNQVNYARNRQADLAPRLFIALIQLVHSASVASLDLC